MFRAHQVVTLSALVALFFAGAVASCGGQSRTIPRATPHEAPLGPSRIAYTERANALCEAQAKAHPLHFLYSTGDHGTESPMMGQRAFGIARAVLVRVQGLTEPRSDLKPLAAIWTARTTQLTDAYASTKYFDKALQAVSNAFKGKPVAPNDYAHLADKFALASYYAGARYSKLATQFGLTACAQLQPTPRGATHLKL